MYTNVEEFTQCQRKCTQVEVLNHPIPHLEFISHIESPGKRKSRCFTRIWFLANVCLLCFTKYVSFKRCCTIAKDPQTLQTCGFSQYVFLYSNLNFFSSVFLHMCHYIGFVGKRRITKFANVRFLSSVNLYMFYQF